MLYLWVRFGVKLRFCLHCNEGESLPFVHLTITDDKGLSSRRHERDTVRTSFNPNRSLDCYALMKPSFCHLFRHFSVTMDPRCALKVAKHLFKNKGYYHHNANDRFGFNSAIFYWTQIGHDRFRIMVFRQLFSTTTKSLSLRRTISGMAMLICWPFFATGTGSRS